MKQFFKIMFASMLGFFLTQIIVFVLFFGILAAIVGTIGKDVVEIEKNSILYLKLDKPLSDRSSNNPFENMDFMNMENSGTQGLNEIVNAIEKAKNDPNISGIFLELSSISGGISTVEEIRNSLLDFKKSRKFIYCYGEYMSQGAYYLASISDKIFVNPEGIVDFKGLNADITFFKGAFEKMGIVPHVLRHGKFKSAVEPFMLDKMSPENRAQTQMLLNSIWSHEIMNISSSRKLDKDYLNLIADSLSIEKASDLVKYKMIDAVKYRDEVIAEIKKQLKVKDKDQLALVDLGKYSKTPKLPNDKMEGAKDRIAIIYAAGEIFSGKGDETKIGSETICEAIEKARNDDKVKAIVLRVNSPGGSALASEVIWREVALTVKVKPVVVSMGDYAASGGYYISSAATKIIANPNTITGSIGVFGLTFSAEKMLNEKLGITFDNVKTNNYSDIGSFYRTMRPDEYAKLLKGVENVYDTFITRVANGRKISKAMVDSIGQGRIWSGVDAKRIGLVDDLGDMKMAVTEAAKLAKISKYRVVSYPKLDEPFDKIVKMFSGNAEAVIMSKLGEQAKYFQMLENIKSWDGIQARIPYAIEIK